MEILDIKQFQTELPGKKLTGHALINNVNVSETKKGQPFLVGKLFVKGEIEFKVWNNSKAFEQLSGGVQGEGIYIVSGEINLYNGTRSLILNQADLDINSGLGKVDFLTSIYDGDRMYEALCTKSQFQRTGIRYLSWLCQVEKKPLERNMQQLTITTMFQVVW